MSRSGDSRSGDCSVQNRIQTFEKQQQLNNANSSRLAHRDPPGLMNVSLSSSGTSPRSQESSQPHHRHQQQETPQPQSYRPQYVPRSMPLAPPSKNGLPRKASPKEDNSATSESISGTPTAPSNAGGRKTGTTKDSEAWRKSGKVFRANLVLEDEEKGGNSFQLSKDCSIERYYRVAERVMEQFLSSSIGESEELTESYLVGSRLVKFLSVVLPTHPEYFSTDPRLSVLRHRSQEQLIELLQFMEELSMLIDEIQYNNYILQDLTPEEQSYVKGIQKNQESDKENHTMTTVDTNNESPKTSEASIGEMAPEVEPERFEQKVATIVAEQAVVKTNGSQDKEIFLKSEKYRRHVAAVLASQPPPPPPPRDSGRRNNKKGQTKEQSFNDPPDWNSTMVSDMSAVDTKVSDDSALTSTDTTASIKFDDEFTKATTEASWDSTFSTKPSRSRIDLLDNVGHHPDPMSEDVAASGNANFPKLRQPRSAPPRGSLATKAYSRQVVPLQDDEFPAFFENYNNKTAAAASQRGQESDLKLRIEQRWDQAMETQRNQRKLERSHLRGQYGGREFYSVSDEAEFSSHREVDNSFDLAQHSNRRLLHQFKGCIKSLLE